MKKTLVRDVMTAAVVTAGEAMPYRDLAGLLYAHGIGAVPVTGPAGQVLGVVSGADLAAKPAGLPGSAAGRDRGQVRPAARLPASRLGDPR